MVVDICVFLLGHGKVLIVVKPFRITNGLVEMQLASCLPSSPVASCNVSFPTCEEQTAPISCVVCHVRAHVKLEVEGLLRLLDSNGLLYFIRSDFISSLKLSLGLKE